MTYTLLITPLARFEIEEMLKESLRDWGETRMKKTLTQLRALEDRLRETPKGPRARRSGFRHLRIGDTPFIAIYRVEGMEVTILTVRHGRSLK